MQAARSSPRGVARPLFRAVACLLATAFLPAGVHALARDGGDRSLFAEGAGNRALAMGGAFVALADDASGLLWNPGGLGVAPRFEIQAMQTDYFALGIAETWAAAVLPSWRWGAAAASFRHVGVGGIEGRDGRNQRTGDFNDSQTEIALGYGRGVGEAWSVGAAFRARMQSVAGYSANGFGFDLGLRGRPFPGDGWTDGLTWGASLRNLVQPTLRLDSESVADPRSVRSGFAYRWGLPGLRSVVAALDVEKPAGLAAEVGGGVEMQILQQFAVRAGWNQGTLAAGTTLRLRDVACDYAFENREFDPVHRIGVTLAFGGSVADARAAAERAEGERLQALLQEGFQRRQTEQIAGLLAGARERADAGAWDEALELLGTAATLDPANPEIRAREAACHRGKGTALEQAGDFAGAAVAFGRAVAITPDDAAAAAGQARCQRESDRRAARTTETRRLFAAALDAFGAGDLATARTGFRSVLAIEANDADAAAMLRRTEDAIARQAQGWVRDAGRSLESGRLDEAAALLDQAAALAPAAEGLAATRAALQRARAAQAAAAAPAARDATRPAPPPASAPIPRRELDAMFRRGLTAMQARRSDEALRYWELVWSAEPSYPQVAEYLKRECLTRGMEAFAAGRLDEAVQFWQRAQRVDPQDPRAAGYLSRAQKQLARTREILGSSQ
jgi:tetratricopeptide (TPR) repeat protein